jgi:hypothetical protein
MRTSTLFCLFLAFGLVFLGSQIGRGAGVVMDCTEASLRTAVAGGGAVTFACDGTITLTDTITITNDTTLDSGAHQITISGSNTVRLFLVCTNVRFSIDHLTLANGRGTNGAGLLNAGGIVCLTNSFFFGNSVLGSAPPPYSNSDGESVAGGAIANQGVLQAANCTFSNNTASGGGGGVAYGGSSGHAGGSGAGGAIWNSGLLLISGCTFAGNFAAGGVGGQGSAGEPLPWPSPGYPGGMGGDGAGGALFNCGIARLVNCTLACNAGAGGSGGPGGPGYRPSPDYPPPPSGPPGLPGSAISGIKDVSAECYLTNCTIAFNSGTGISTAATNGLKLINTLLAGNVPGGNGSGTLTDLGHNLSSDTTCAFTNTGSLNNTFPALGLLNDNGGPTLTVAVLPGSVAIDSGDTVAAPAFDQRGVARPFGIAADIGAYEYNQATNPGSSAVVTECTEVGLRTAISTGGHVTFACDGTIAISNTVLITTNILLDATGHQIILQGGGTRLFQVGAGSTFSVANLVIAGGSADNGAAIQNAGGFVNATNCRFSGNAAVRGGAIQNQAGTVCLSACVFINNRALGVTGASGRSGGTGWGGALDNSGTLIVDLCTFASNSAVGTDGLSGGWYGETGGPGGDAAGGAIYNSQTVTITRSTFSNNFVVAGKGAAGYFGPHGDPGFNGGNGAAGGAGGKAEGGALYNASTARLMNSTFALNSGAGGNGGAGGDGGAAYGGGKGGDGAGGGPGGTGVGAVFNSGDVQIINSTFAFNSGSAGNGGQGGHGGDFGGSGGSGASGGAGVGALADDSSCRVTNCTFAANSAMSGMGGNGGGGGGYPGIPGSPGLGGVGSGAVKTIGGKLINTILAANLPGGNATGTVIDLGHNLSSDATCAFTNVGSLNNSDPKLGPLANNGGPTLTMSLLRGSPAVDAGDDAVALAEDQRGLPRPIGSATDIGAFEYGSPAFLTLVPNVAGGLDLTVIGQRWQTCKVMASETLLNWQPVSTNQFGADGTLIFHDHTVPAQKFYRVLLP